MLHRETGSNAGWKLRSLGRRVAIVGMLALVLCARAVAEQADTQPKPVVPDLSSLDADTLRAVAKQLYVAIDEAKRKLSDVKTELTAAKAENSRLKAIVERLQKDLSKLQDEQRGARSRTSNSGGSNDTGTPAPSQVRTPDAADDEPKLEKATGELTPAQRTIREQAHPFSELNEQPNEYLGKPITLFGYALLTKHTSEGMFEDRGTPRQFVALCDVDGQRVFVSFPKQGNEKLFDLLGSKGKVPIKVDATGISTRQHQVFEAAGGKWETIDESTGNPSKD